MAKILLITLLTFLPVFAQESAEAKAKAEAKEAAEAKLEPWKWANFAILAVFLGYMATKHLGAEFREKSEEIRKGIADAAAQQADAERKIAEIDRRVSALGAEVEKIRTESASEMQREGERIRKETAAAIAKVEQQANFEVETAGKVARHQLRDYASDLALKQAEERLRSQLNATSEGALIDNFISDLARQGSKN